MMKRLLSGEDVDQINQFLGQAYWNNIPWVKISLLENDENDSIHFRKD